MTTVTKFVVSVVLTAGIIVLGLHGLRALGPAIPRDMPSDSHFIQSGYDLRRNEPLGDWIACRADATQGTDFCRVTDFRGAVIYQGDFVPLRSRRGVADVNLQFAAADARHLWVKGPVERSPVPVIPLANGELLVPAVDSVALADRWARDPDELTRLELPFQP